MQYEIDFAIGYLLSHLCVRDCMCVCPSPIRELRRTRIPKRGRDLTCEDGNTRNEIRRNHAVQQDN